MTEKTEIAMQTEDEKHVVIVQDESSLSPPTNLVGLDQTEINKILKDLEQQTQILTETSKKIDMQKKIIKNLTSKVDDDDDDEDEESDDDYESAEEEVEEEDIRWTAMLKLLDAHRNISESVHKLIHENDEDEDEDE
jgi:hypothetical protein